MVVYSTLVTLIQPSAAGNHPTEWTAWGRRITPISGDTGEYDGALTGSTSQVWDVDVGGSTVAGIGTRWRVRIDNEVLTIESAFKPREEFPVWRLVLAGSSLSGTLAP